jgi:hypothetical protein
LYLPAPNQQRPDPKTEALPKQELVGEMKLSPTEFTMSVGEMQQDGRSAVSSMTTQ